jgi:ATP-binding cassette, subfamily B, bacterial MsbA
MRTITRLARYIFEEKALIFSGLILTALIGLTEVFTGTFLKLLTDSVKSIGDFLTAGNREDISIPLRMRIPGIFSGKRIDIVNSVWNGEDEILTGMITVALLFTVIYLFQVLFDYLRDVSLGTANQRIMKKIKCQIFEKVVSMESSQLKNEKPGDLMSRVTYDAMVLANIMDIFVELVRSLVYIMIFVPLMFVINWKVAFFTAVFFPLTFFVIKKFSKTVKKSSKRVTDSTADYTAFLENNINKYRIIEEIPDRLGEMKSFNGLVEKNYKDNVSLIVKKSFLKPANEFMGTLGLAVATVFFSYLIVRHDFNAGNAVFFLYMMKTSYKPFKKVAQASGELFNSLVCAEKIFDLLDR